MKSVRQIQMLNEIDICNKDNEDYEVSQNNDVQNGRYKICSVFNRCYTLDYPENLRRCVVNKAEILKSQYNLDLFLNPFQEISNNEILLYRYKLEKKLQEGLHALIEIQFLDSLVVLRKQECKEKLEFNMKELQNMKFLMKNLVKFFNLNPPTAAIEIYNEEKKNIAKRLNFDFTYKSPEVIEITKSNIKLQALSIALGKQRQCRVERNENTGNLFYLSKINNCSLDPVCQEKISMEHKSLWI